MCERVCLVGLLVCVAVSRFIGNAATCSLALPLSASAGAGALAGDLLLDW